MAKDNFLDAEREIEKNYKEHAPLIKELIKWCAFLHVEVITPTGGVLAFIIDTEYSRNPSKWKSEIKDLMELIVHQESGKYRHILNFRLIEMELSIIAEELAGNRTLHDAKNKLRRRMQLLNESREGLKGLTPTINTVLIHPRLSLEPKWYNIAIRKQHLFEASSVRRALQPLIEIEDQRDNRKVQILNELNDLMTRHMWEAHFDGRIMPLFDKMKKQVHAEIEARHNLKRHSGTNKVHNLTEIVGKLLRLQMSIVRSIKKELRKTNIPSHEVNLRVNALISELESVINQELPKS